MKITIQGLDYTSALDAVHPLTIERKLNQPSQCRFWLTLGAGENLAVPTRGRSVAITGDDGTLFFTGYIVAIPLPEYIGEALQGPLYRLAIVALSDECLIDQLPMPASAGITGDSVGSVMGALITHSGSTTLAESMSSPNLVLSNFVAEAGTAWSRSARRVADMAGAAYRVLEGVLSLFPIGTVVHALEESSDGFNPGNLTLTPSIDRLPANDVTLCGEREPVAYVTEFFRGDGVTSTFYLADEPYSPPSPTSKIIRELFDEPEIDARIWANTGESGYIALGGGGLAMRGGNGIDGQTTLSWLDPVEMGGTLLLEAVGVTFALGSAGIVGGFFDGGMDSASCTAGFQATAEEGTGTLKLQPLIQGLASGTAFNANPSNQYNLRLRVHSPECHRVLAMYRSCFDGGTVTAGGEWNLSSGKLQFEIQEFVNGVGGMPVTLFDGAVASLPGVCTVVAASSLNLVGSMRAMHLTNLGSGWVVSTPPGGGAYTRRLGSLVEAGECQFQAGGKLQFQTGNIPVVGELVAASYRTSGRAIGRAVNSENQQSLTNAGLPAVASWTGSVTEPQARCSADCRNAAFVTAQSAAEDSSVLRGSYKGTNFEFASDVWPGDALQIHAPSANLESQVIVREVNISYSASLPDLVKYGIRFANDWTENLTIKRSSAVPDDVWLHVPATPTVLQTLSGLTVTTLNGSTVGINTGVLPPSGGGFEVRRQDFEFMPGTDPGLVIRSNLPNITFSRESTNDRFYVRMYDGATPPNYSEFSTALFINLPLGS
jgi:hypothetical protein